MILAALDADKPGVMPAGMRTAGKGRPDKNRGKIKVSAVFAGEKEERPLPDSNRGWRICNPLP